MLLIFYPLIKCDKKYSLNNANNEINFHLCIKVTANLAVFRELTEKCW